MGSATDIVGQACAACDRPGTGIDVHAAIEWAFPHVMADAEACHVIVREGLGHRIRNTATRHTKWMRKHLTQQEEPELFGLRPAYCLDTDGSRIKRTRDLTRAEFNRIIEIRQAQLYHDQEQLHLLVRAERRVRRVWESNPSMTFGEIAALLELQPEPAE